MLRDLFSLFPAYAGVIPANDDIILMMAAFPRTCGGDPELQTEADTGVLFSPHMRG